MKLANPGIDLEPFLVNSTTFFKNYIENGLKSIDAERKTGSGSSIATPPTSRSLEQLQQQATTASRSGSSQSLVDGFASSSNGSSAMTTPDYEGGGGGGGTNPSFYMERLKVLRAKCGLDNPRVPPTSGLGGGVISDKDAGFEKICSSSSLNVDDTNNAPSSGGGGGGGDGGGGGRSNFGTISLSASHKMGGSLRSMEADVGDVGAANGEGNKDVEDLKRRLEMIKSKRKM